MHTQQTSLSTFSFTRRKHYDDLTVHFFFCQRIAMHSSVQHLQEVSSHIFVMMMFSPLFDDVKTLHIASSLVGIIIIVIREWTDFIFNTHNTTHSFLALSWNHILLLHTQHFGISYKFWIILFTKFLHHGIRSALSPSSPLLYFCFCALVDMIYSGSHAQFGDNFRRSVRLMHSLGAACTCNPKNLNLLSPSGCNCGVQLHADSHIFFLLWIKSIIFYLLKKSWSSCFICFGIKYKKESKDGDAFLLTKVE